MAQLFIFDVDGLLVDTEPIHYEAWMTIFKRLGIDMSIEEYGKLFTGTSDAFVAEWLSKNHEGQFLNEKIDLFWELSKKAKPMPGVVTLLNRLKGRKSVASSSFVPLVKRMLKAAKLIHFFEDFTGGDEVKHLKPAPDIYLLAAKKANVQPKDCVAFEDSGSGVLSASSAGMNVVAVPTVFTRDHDFSMAYKVLDSIDEFSE